MQSNKTVFHDLNIVTSDKYYVQMLILTKHTICESLMKIQYFRHEKSTTMYENTLKMQ